MAVETSSGAETAAVTEFHQLGLDPRLLRAVAKKGFGAPSRVQAEVLPSALEGRDVVAAARTGSGKTMAYLLPTLHRVLTSGKGKGGWQALILVPTRELCQQVREEVQSVAEHCGSHVLKATALTAEGAAAQRQQLSSVGQVVVATPGRIASLLKSGALPPRVLSRNLEMLVLDEADLLLSFGYEDDVKEIVPHIQRSVQCMLMSATTSEDVKRLQALVLHNPVVLSLLDDLKEGAGDCNGASASTDIEHFRFDCSTSDRLLVTMALLKLGAIKRKVLIFVNSIDTGFQLRLFLERFGIRTALLNAELPLNSRHHILQEFNKGLFDYLIATDNIYGAHKAQAAAEKTRGKGDKRKGPRKDGEFGVTRGVDFRGVSTVLNFDMPDSVEGYVHRVGRTGRAGQKGVALALVTPQTREIAEKVEAALVTDAPAVPAAEDGDEGGGASVAQGLKPFTALTKKAVDALRYRAEDVARSITRSSVKEARAKELRLEMLNSERLKDHFEERPGDLAILKHDKLLHKTQELTHLKHIPQYLRDVDMQKGSSNVGGGKGVLPRRKQMKQKSKQLDPLKALGGFKTTKREEEPTELEKRAEGWAKKNAPKNKKMEPILKGNVKKRRKV